MAEERTITHDQLLSFATRSLIKAGMDETDAAIVARIQVEADLRGVHTHGVAGLLGYVRRLRAGGTNPRAVPRVVVDGPTTAVLDGDNGPGQLVGYRAMHVAIEKARELGVGMVTARNSNHFGAAAYYAAMALDHDLIGFAATSAGCRIAPPGGKQAVVGNNPFAYAIPAGQERPILLDMAQSVVAAGKLGMAARKGESIPLGWALDADGRPTTDPHAGQRGLLVPIGGAKGYGLAVVVDALSGLMGGALFGLEMSYARGRSDADPSQLGHSFMAIDPSRFMPIDEFKAKVDRMIRDIHGAERAEGVDRVYLPGEIEHRLKERRLAEGIPLLTSLVDDLNKLGREAGLSDAELLQ